VILLQTKYIGLILGVLVLVILVSGCIADSKTMVNVVNNTYSGEGVSFNIPNNWQVSKIVDGSTTNIDINKINPTDGTSITVAISPNPIGVSNQDLINSIQNPTDQAGRKKILNTTSTVDGNIAYENTYIVNDSSRFNQTMKEQQINFIKNGTTYGLVFDAPVQSFDQEISNFNITFNSFRVL
jgi:PsbP-like protein